MAHYKFDLVQETSTSTGTGALTLAGAVTRRKAFSAVLSNADTCYVLIESASAAEWEICLATYNSGGNTLSRGTVLASSTGSAVSFSAGTKTISLVAPAAKSIVEDNNGDTYFTGYINMNGYRALYKDASFQYVYDSASNTVLWLSAARAVYDSDWHNFRKADHTTEIGNLTSAYFRPGADNTQTLGGSSFRWSVVYSATGAINTSGADAKLFIGEASDAEKRAAVRIKAGVRRYKMADAVAAKGEALARWHFGYIAEDVRDAMEAEGLDASQYGFFCADPIIRIEVTSENGIETRNEIETGEVRLGLRYSELEAFLRSAE
jgi:hypothetical protein